MGEHIESKTLTTQELKILYTLHVNAAAECREDAERARQAFAFGTCWAAENTADTHERIAEGLRVRIERRVN